MVIALTLVATQLGQLLLEQPLLEQPLLEQRADGIDAVFLAALTSPPATYPVGWCFGDGRLAGATEPFPPPGTVRRCRSQIR